MNAWPLILLTVVGIGAYGLTRLGAASGEIVTQVAARIFKIDISNLTVAIDAIIKNPTNTEINIQYPFIKIIHQGSVLASSELKDEVIKIKPFAQTKISNIKVPISYLYMAGLAPEVLKRVKDSTHKIEIQIGVETRVIFAGRSIPYSNVQTVKI